jgi:hypothetical protein
MYCVQYVRCVRTVEGRSCKKAAKLNTEARQNFARLPGSIQKLHTEADNTVPIGMVETPGRQS